MTLVTLAAGCTSSVIDDEASSDDSAVTVDTRNPNARRQYDANVAFANGYVARCARPTTNRPRVLVTGFGRFMSITNNATGRIVSALVPRAVYPETTPPADSTAVDPPAPQLSVGMTTLQIEGIGPVDVCGLILPVYWDLAGIVIAKEAEAFSPSLVVMNGVAAPRQPLWIELGAINRAQRTDDGSNQLRPAMRDDEDYAKIIETATESEEAQANLLSWRAVETAARVAIDERAELLDGDKRLGDLLQGVMLAGYPRSSNTYLCNNVTYVTGWLMGHPGKSARLLRANPRIPGAINDVRVSIKKDLRAVPRVFMHWPAEMADAHHRAGADIMTAIIAAQLEAISSGEAPELGDNTLADPTLQSGGFF